MDYRIEKLDAFKVIGKFKNVTKPENNDATEEISAYWNKCGADGTVQKICEYFPEKTKLKGLLGICFSGEIKNSQFPYAIAVEYDGRKADEEFEIVEIPSYTYAVFTCKGKMPEAFTNTYKKICTEFFPQSDKYEYGNGVELEVYPSDNVNDPNYTCEIWIAVKEK